MKYSFSRSARKDLKTLPLHIQVRIIKKMKFFVAQDNPLDFAKHIVGGENIYRFRVGKYCIIFEFSYKEILVLKVDIRGSVYK
jgi:mRNA-degrading endonuclease RelE of RelBE toxin-antitoxin system